ncbi:MAG: hypothetical protein NWE95_03410 [Candidatus Bathyarchaeota archaeon]|nr:hypothetical protein [Candidatus Bathyarchaeota archaeon]
MMMYKHSSAKRASVIAMTAALYAVFFFLSWSVTLPHFTLLYLPIILLGVFPVWFGWSGLVGSMIGGFIGGAFVEGLGFLGVFESVVALIIYLINWVLMPKGAAENGERKGLFVLLGVYAFSLFVGTSYILWQYTVLPQLFSASEALVVLGPTFALNLPIVLIASPALLRVVSPKLRLWGMYVGNFAEWRSGATVKPR